MPVDTNVTRQIAQSFPYLPLAGGTMGGNIVQFGQINYIRSQDTDAIVTVFDYILNIAPTAADRTVTFPASAGFAVGQTFIVRRNASTDWILGTGNRVVIQSSAAETFNGNANVSLVGPFETLQIINVGGGWVYPSGRDLFVQKDGDIMNGDLTIDGRLYSHTMAGGISLNKGLSIVLDDDGTSQVIIQGSSDILTLADKNYSKSLSDLNKFIGQSDTPANYTSAGSKMVRVNAGATALEFVTDDHITKADTSYFRRFFQGEGSIVQGTWVWTTNASETNYASVRAQAAGWWENSSHINLDEYKWSSLYLGPGTYEIDIVYNADPNKGKCEIIFGNTVLATVDMYHAVSATYNNAASTDLVLSTQTTADLRLRCNGKNASSSNYYINFSRLEIFKKG